MSKTKISGFYDEISDNLSEQVAVIKELGETYMCPRKLNGKSIANYTPEEFASEIKPILDKNGIKFSSIGSPIGKIKLDDEEAFVSQLAQLKNLVRIAAMMDCKYIRIFSFFVDPKGDYSAYHPKVVEKLRKLLETVEGTDIILLHENEKHIYGDVPSRCLALIKEINHPNFRLAFDSSNFIQCDSEPFAAYNLLKEYVDYYHVKDCSPEKVEVPLGMGNGKYQEILNDLICVRGYDGFLTLEPHTLKYSIAKKIVYALRPIAVLVKPIKEFPKVFRRIDKAYGKKPFETVSRKEVFLWQYKNLVKMLCVAEGLVENK